MCVDRDVRLYRIGCGAALVAGPALFFVDNLIHPEELGRGNEAAQLAAIAADSERWQIAHLIGFLSLLVFAAALFGLAYVVRRQRPRLGLAAGAAGVAGVVGGSFPVSPRGVFGGGV